MSLYVIPHSDLVLLRMTVLTRMILQLLFLFVMYETSESQLISFSMLHHIDNATMIHYKLTYPWWWFDCYRRSRDRICVSNCCWCVHRGTVVPVLCSSIHKRKKIKTVWYTYYIRTHLAVSRTPWLNTMMYSDTQIQSAPLHLMRELLENSKNSWLLSTNTTLFNSRSACLRFQIRCINTVCCGIERTWTWSSVSCEICARK